MTADGRASTRCSCATGTTGIRATPTSPGPSTDPEIHSHDYIDPSTPLDLYGKRVLVVGIGNSAVDIVSELASQDCVRHRLPLDPLGRVRRPEVHLRQAGRPGRQDEPAAARSACSDGSRRVLPRIFSGRMEDFGLPTPNHNFLDAHPTVSSELLGRLGAGDAVAKGDVAELLGDRVRFARRHRRAGRRDRVRHRLQRQLPVLRPRRSSRRRKTRCRSTSGCSSPGSTTSRSSGSASRFRRSSRSPSCSQSSPRGGSAGIGRHRLTARWRRRSVATRRSTLRHFINKPRHTMQLEWYALRARAQHPLDPGRPGACARRRAHRPCPGGARRARCEARSLAA